MLAELNLVLFSLPVPQGDAISTNESNRSLGGSASPPTWQLTRLCPLTVINNIPCPLSLRVCLSFLVDGMKPHNPIFPLTYLTGSRDALRTIASLQGTGTFIKGVINVMVSGVGG